MAIKDVYRLSSVVCFVVNKEIEMTRKEDGIRRFNHTALSKTSVSGFKAR